MGTFFEVILEYLQAGFAMAQQAIVYAGVLLDIMFNVIPFVTGLGAYLFPPLAICAILVLFIGFIKFICSVIGTGLDLFI